MIDQFPPVNPTTGFSLDGSVDAGGNLYGGVRPTDISSIKPVAAGNQLVGHRGELKRWHVVAIATPIVVMLLGAAIHDFL